MRSTILYWEDAATEETTLGPFAIEPPEVAAYEALVGGRADPGLVPDPLLQSLLAGLVGEHLGYPATVALRSERWSRARPLGVGETFFIRTRTTLREPVDAERGLVDHERLVLCDGEVLLKVRSSALLRRRPAP